MFITLFHFHSHKPNPVYQEISAGLRRRGHKVWVGQPNAEGNLLWHDGEKIVATLPGPFPNNIGREGNAFQRRYKYMMFMLRVRAFLREQRPDIVQVNPSNMLSWVLTLGMPRECHFVLDIRQINEAVDNRLITKVKEQRDIAGMKMLASLYYEHTCFCHAGAAEKILGPGWQRNSTVVPVGIDPQFLSYNGFDVSKPDNDLVNFIYIGTLSRLRTLEQILTAARLLKNKTTDFHLDLVGPDMTEGYYQSLIDQWGIGEVAAVRKAVPYAQIPDTLKNYDVGVAYVPDRPTWHYQPTIKVLEYRAIGLPILSTDVATHREIVRDGLNGLLVQDTPESIAAGMERFVSDPAFLQQCRKDAQLMRRGLSWDEVAKMYDEQVYCKLVTGKSL